MKIECQKCHAPAIMEAALVAHEEVWKPYCLVHLAELVSQEEMLVRRIGQG